MKIPANFLAESVSAVVSKNVSD